MLKNTHFLNEFYQHEVLAHFMLNTLEDQKPNRKRKPGLTGFKSET